MTLRHVCRAVKGRTPETNVNDPPVTDERTSRGVIGATVNHTVEGFVKAAAVELPRNIRIKISMLRAIR